MRSALLLLPRALALGVVLLGGVGELVTLQAWRLRDRLGSGRLRD
ncbi:MAG TPA: hypothetical protein VFE82_07000 [Ramlibacter sp.]|jgi:hypothetical protein|nr:hypothetical protein [Ramlibacter sp.]HZY18212.1 hypothetical protein [Ramlibacter sp.]